MKHNLLSFVLIVLASLSSVTVWGGTVETLTWALTANTNCSGGTNISGSAVTPVNGTTYSAGAWSISSSKYQSESKKHSADSYWEDFSSCTTSGCADPTSTARLEFPITIGTGYALNISSVSIASFEQGGGGGPAIQAYIVQGSTKTWLGYSLPGSPSFSGLDIDLSTGNAKLVLILGVNNNLTNSRAFKLTGVSISGTSKAATPADRYTFHRGLYDADKTTYSITDFVKQGYANEWQIENFVFPTAYNHDSACYVGWNGYWYNINLAQNGSSDEHADQSVKLRYEDIEMSKIMQDGDCANKKVGWDEYNAHGAIGTLRIFDNYNNANVFLGFIPNGYALMYGVAGGSDPWQEIPFSINAGSADSWRTEAFDVPTSGITASNISYYVGISHKDGGYVFCGQSHTYKMTSEEGKRLESTTTGRGCFRINEHACTNFGCQFVPTHRIIYHANYPVGVSPTDTYSEDVMSDKTKALSLNAAPTAPSGYTFTGWNARADGTDNSSERLSAGGEYILDNPSADVELYAQWEEGCNDELFVISNATGASSSSTWTATANSDITMAGSSSISLKSGTTCFKVTSGSTMTFNVPDYMQVTEIKITGYSSSSSKSTITIAGTTSSENQFDQTQHSSITYSVTSPAYGQDYTMSVANKEFELESVTLYGCEKPCTATTLTLTPSVAPPTIAQNESLTLTPSAGNGGTVVYQVQTQTGDGVGTVTPAGVFSATKPGIYKVTARQARRTEGMTDYCATETSIDITVNAPSYCFELTGLPTSGSVSAGNTLGGTITGGTAVFTGASASASYSSNGLKFSANEDVVRVSFAPGSGLVAGTQITISGSTGSSGKGLILYYGDDNLQFVKSGSSGSFTVTKTVSAETDLDGTDEFYIKRVSGTDSYLKSIQIAGCGAVCKAPTISFASTTINYTIDDVASAIDVSFTGMPTTVTWFSNTTASTSGATNLGTTAPTPSTVAVGKTYYYCTATNSCGTTTSEFVEVNVDNGPCFSIVAPDAAGNVNKDASLTTGGVIIALGGDATYVRQDGTSMTIEAGRGIKIDNSKDIIQVTMPAGSCLGIGTTIKVTGYVSGANRGIGIYTTNAGQQIQMVKPSTSGNYDLSYTLQAGDPWLDAETFYIQRVSGCTYLKTLTITNCGTPCTEAIPVISTTDPTTKCPGASVTMTCTGAEVGATLQWYKDGAAIVGATSSSYETIEPGEYTCIASNMCSRTSNPIKIINKDMAMVHPVYSSYYIKQGRVSPPIPLFEVPGVVTWSISPTIAGCTYEKEGDIIYLKGVPTGIDANGDETLTLTYDLGCGSSTTPMLLHELAATAKPTVAYIVEGTTDGSFTDGIKAGQSTSHTLYQYIEDNGYTLTACNEYSTVDEKAIVEYYTQYDIVLITDYPSTKKKNSAGKSYGNALGVLVDKVPVLSLETFLSGNSNWSKIGLSANPHTPQDAGGNNDDQFTMDLLCPAHDIFEGDIEIIDNKINVITEFAEDGDDNTTGMQGFSSLEAPDGFIFIATINGGKHGTLVTCCERQTVVEARLLLFGVNYYGSASMTANGKLAVKQMLDYLLKKEKSQVADCAEIFDNGLNNGTPRHTIIGDTNYTSGDSLWSNPANWTDGHLPNALKAVLVEQPCFVDVPSAHASSIKLCKGTNEKGIACDGKLTIHPEGGLSVSSSIVKVNGTDHVSTLDIAASDLIIEANASSQGALALGTKGQGTSATVQYYSKAIQSTTASTWQYMGVPFAEMNHAVDYFRGAWMCEWLEGIPAGAAGANWAYIANDDVLNPFQGYAITQPAAKKYTHTGMLLSADTRVIDLSYTTVAGNTYQGCNLVANSWMAPIRVKDFEASDFHNANATIYIYNTGSYTDWETNGEGADTHNETTTAGQYVSLPIAAVGAWDISKFREIPPMQGFFVKATASDATLTLDFSKLVYSGETLTNKPQRAPQQLRTPFCITVSGARLADELYILPDEEYTRGFDNGYDAHKMEGDERAPMLALRHNGEDFAIAAVPTADSSVLVFRGGEDTDYTMYFSGVPASMELVDLYTGAIISLSEQTTYSFNAGNEASERFLIRQAQIPAVATEIENLSGAAGARQVYDALGRRIDASSCPPGVYIVNTQTATGRIATKVIY